jgi:hypothetical protein
MGFKRKRSVDESPISVSSFGTFATPEAQSPTPLPNSYGSMMDLDAPMSRGTGWDFSNLGRIKSSDWGLRTRKRVRDNRPDEHIIHGIHSTSYCGMWDGEANEPRNHHQQAVPRTTQAATRRAHTIRHAACATSTRPTEAAEVNTARVLEDSCTAGAAADSTDASPPRRERAAVRGLRHPTRERRERHGCRYG